MHSGCDFDGPRCSSCSTVHRLSRSFYPQRVVALVNGRFSIDGEIVARSFMYDVDNADDAYSRKPVTETSLENRRALCDPRALSAGRRDTRNRDSAELTACIIPRARRSCLTLLDSASQASRRSIIPSVSPLECRRCLLKTRLCHQ